VNQILENEVEKVQKIEEGNGAILKTFEDHKENGLKKIIETTDYTLKRLEDAIVTILEDLSTKMD
jgi:hypothetical protein